MGRVFIGSSSKGRVDLETVRGLIRSAKLDPWAWSDPGAFIQGVSTWERLVQLTREVDAAAFIFREDDEGVIGKEQHAVTRDNVILECGLFSGVLGPRKCAIFLSGHPWVPGDLSGITYVQLEDVQRAQAEVDVWSRNLKASNVPPIRLTLDQVGAICRAMTGSGIPMNRVYSLMELLGAGPSYVNDGINKGAGHPPR
jgi:predicted nucleotide-binding protein